MPRIKGFAELREIANSIHTCEAAEVLTICLAAYLTDNQFKGSLSLNFHREQKLLIHDILFIPSYHRSVNAEG